MSTHSQNWQEHMQRLLRHLLDWVAVLVVIPTER